MRRHVYSENWNFDLFFNVTELFICCFLSSEHLHCLQWRKIWTTDSIPHSPPLNGTATHSLMATGRPALRMAFSVSSIQMFTEFLQAERSNTYTLNQTGLNKTNYSYSIIRAFIFLISGRCLSPCHRRVTRSWWWSRQRACSGLSRTCSGPGGNFQNLPG